MTDAQGSEQEHEDSPVCWCRPVPLADSDGCLAAMLHRDRNGMLPSAIVQMRILAEMADSDLYEADGMHKAVAGYHVADDGTVTFLGY